MAHKLFLTLLWLSAAASASAQSVCSSDGQRQPVALLERFINADCDACWRDAATPQAGPRELALDWIVPGSKGDDAPLSMGALPEGLVRLAALQRKPPGGADSARSRRVAPWLSLRVAQGQPINDYIGTSIELRNARGGPWQAWLLLVETLPAGAEGSPVPRNLVRNVFQPPWDGRRGPATLYEARAMQIHEGTDVERLRLVALVHDAKGRLVAAVQSRCKAE
jgi:hypothetical protein